MSNIERENIIFDEESNEKFRNFELNDAENCCMKKKAEKIGK